MKSHKSLVLCCKEILSRVEEEDVKASVKLLLASSRIPRPTSSWLLCPLA